MKFEGKEWNRTNGVDKLTHNYWSQVNNSGKYYQHAKGRPQQAILNFDSADARNLLQGVFTHWIEKGVSGFYIGNTHYIARDSSQKADYTAIIHNLGLFTSELTQLLNETDYVDKKILLFTSVGKGVDAETRHKMVSEGGIHYLIDTGLTRVTEADAYSKIKQIVQGSLTFRNTFNDSVLYEFGSAYDSRIASRLDGDLETVELVTMLQLMLPGPSNYYYGDAIGMSDLNEKAVDKYAVTKNKLQKIEKQRGAMKWDEGRNFAFSDSDKTKVPSSEGSENFAKSYYAEDSMLKTFKKLARLKGRDETLQAGEFVFGPDSEDTLTFGRSMNFTGPESTVYVGVLNFGNATRQVELDESIRALDSGTAVVVIASSNHKRAKYVPRDKIDIKDNTVEVGARTGVILKFKNPKE